MGHWYDALRREKSRGSQAERPGSLAGLAAARRVHMGQFFTPDAVAAAMWNVVSPAMDGAIVKGNRSIFSIIDNSVGSGRLLQFAEPEKHHLTGIDVDESLLVDVGQVVEKAGFNCNFESCGMEEISPHGFDVALINPPFSVHIESPLLSPYPCTSYGKFGPNTATVSHAYAVAQAIDAAEVVVALLPTSFVDELVANPDEWLFPHGVSRLAGIYDLPSRSFREEGTDVSTSLMVFSLDGVGFGQAPRYQLVNLADPLPPIAPVKIHGERLRGKLSRHGVDDEGPSITIPVTGDSRVFISHDGRRIRLTYQCGLTQAKVANAILRCHAREDSPPLHRRPKGLSYSGQGVLDFEVHLAQDDPICSFEQFVEAIEAAGGSPVVAPGMREYLRRRARKSQRQAEPLRHSVMVEKGVAAGTANVLKAMPRKIMVADPKVWGSPTLKPGQEVEMRREPHGDYSFDIGGKSYSMPEQMLYERFVVTEGAAQAGWTEVHAGLHCKFSDMSQGLRHRASALGIDKWLSWGYQLDDAIELAMKPHGAIAAWHMGLGKARLAVALIMLVGCRHGLIVTEAGLIDEMLIELKGLPISADSWQIITTPAQARNLRQINVISYERLRLVAKADDPATDKRKLTGSKRMHHTYAGLMRRRIGVLVADEGDVLSNPQSDQTQALYQLSPKRRYVAAATPLANYPRDVAPILAFAGGDGTAAQPWGWRRGYLEKNWRQSVSQAERGVEAFRNTFVTTAWATREFDDTLIEGAKREIPRINNLAKYRAMLAPHVKRRVIEEPDVAKYISIPKSTREVVEVPWDDAHLAFYIRLAEESASWYQQTNRTDGRMNNLIAILARIRAVSFASDYPQHGVEGFGAYAPLTSKQRWAIDEIERLTAAGKKTVLYAENPGQVELLYRHLAERGVEAVRFHGQIPVKQRTQELNRRFRFGDCPNLLATLGVTQKGLNLWQAEEEILLSRSWSATVEEQAIARLLRPQQKKHVRVRYVQLPGGIDSYKEQLVNFKKDSARAGLDWGTPETEDVDFLHLDTVLNRFAEDVAKLHNIKRWDLSRYLQNLSRQAKEAANA